MKVMKMIITTKIAVKIPREIRAEIKWKNAYKMGRIQEDKELIVE